MLVGQLRPSCAARVHAGSESLIVGRDYAVSSYTSAQTGLRPDAEIHCEHCGVRIVGHGLEKDGRMFCCDHCAEGEGVTELRDQV